MVGNSKPLCGTDTALKVSQPLIHHILTTTLGEASSVISILLGWGGEATSPVRAAKGQAGTGLGSPACPLC